MNTIGCSPIERNRLSSWLLWEPVDDSETLVGNGTTDGQEGAWPEPGSLLRGVQPHLHELAGTRLKSPTLNKLAELCEVMEIHPMTLLALAYSGSDRKKLEQLLSTVRDELELLATD